MSTLLKETKRFRIILLLFFLSVLITSIYTLIEEYIPVTFTRWDVLGQNLKLGVIVHYIRFSMIFVFTIICCKSLNKSQLPSRLFILLIFLLSFTYVVNGITFSPGGLVFTIDTYWGAVNKGFGLGFNLVVIIISVIFNNYKSKMKLIFKELEEQRP